MTSTTIRLVLAQSSSNHCKGAPSGSYTASRYGPKPYSLEFRSNCHAPMNSCSVVIATLDRVERLKDVLADLAQQTRPPGQVIISAAGNSAATVLNLSSEFSQFLI